MICPVCQTTLLITDRQGVEIDYCPKCRGVWLDRGELQKLIDLSLAQVSPPQPTAMQRNDSSGYDPSREQRGRYYEEGRYPDRHPDSHYGHGKPKKRESWFSELFDFD